MFHYPGTSVFPMHESNERPYFSWRSACKITHEACIHMTVRRGGPCRPRKLLLLLPPHIQTASLSSLWLRDQYPFLYLPLGPSSPLPLVLIRSLNLWRTHTHRAGGRFCCKRPIWAEAYSPFFSPHPPFLPISPRPQNPHKPQFYNKIAEGFLLHPTSFYTFIFIPSSYVLPTCPVWVKACLEHNTHSDILLSGFNELRLAQYIDYMANFQPPYCWFSLNHLASFVWRQVPYFGRRSIQETYTFNDLFSFS